MVSISIELVHFEAGNTVWACGLSLLVLNVLLMEHIEDKRRGAGVLGLKFEVAWVE